MLKHYVEFLYPGIVVGEYSSEPTETRDPKYITAPEGAVAFRFYDVEEVTIDGETLTGKNKDYSGWFYVVGRAMTLEDVRREMPSKKVLIGNMESNGMDRVVSFPNGITYELHPEDIVLELPSERSCAHGV